MTAPATPRRVTVGDSALRNAESAPPTPERATSETTPGTLHSAITGRSWARWVRDEFRMPSPLADRAPAVDELRKWADRDGWTANHDGLPRLFGRLYNRLVAIPYTVWSRMRESVVQRPARFFVVAVTVKFLSFSAPVSWAVDHLLVPTARFALWLFL